MMRLGFLAGYNHPTDSLSIFEDSGLDSFVSSDGVHNLLSFYVVAAGAGLDVCAATGSGPIIIS